MTQPDSQSSEKPKALELLQNFLKENNIQLKTMPLKTWTDEKGRFVIDPPQIMIEYQKSKK